ncbi:hypothetical protein BH11MYX1_BH11MYX1_41420 [soil metagenome]
MPPTLPSTFGTKCWVLAALAVLSVGGCHREPPPLAPGEPIPAAAEIQVDTMDQECDTLLAAIKVYGECPFHDDDDRAWAKNLARVAQEAFDAGHKGTPDAPSQHVIALACHRAAVSITNATERCSNGPKPKRQY